MGRVGEPPSWFAGRCVERLDHLLITNAVQENDRVACYHGPAKTFTYSFLPKPWRPLRGPRNDQAGLARDAVGRRAQEVGPVSGHEPRNGSNEQTGQAEYKADRVQSLHCKFLSRRFRLLGREHLRARSSRSQMLAAKRGVAV
jgi:hypothetical protein